ncbi:MAG: ribonuclease E/G [Rhodospirillales bacterium]|nr:MAG: ribonuclease E/G [Rhodospirillales bacterium]
MAIKRMLLDAAHPEETRVAVIEGDRLTDYDVEVASRRQLKGNIYLAKVTRVEPSLQAAFVEYGGNRHGFLAFNEIHPDYYQIPVADREALLAEQAAAEQVADAAKPVENATDNGDGVDTVGGVDDDEDDVELPHVRPSSRHYKIQEVIKRRQILLVQVTKEERGTKGAALTTYLSLAGRYCVLMPNTVRGGGISRKITSATDRKRLKKIVGELGVPEGMAVILRTAGSERSKAEIRRDYEYLIRLWSSIREVTLKSMAPTLVYEEGNLIKRSIRDLYDRSTDEILVEGETAYRTAKDFMRLFIPSHAKRVKLYEEARRPLFLRYNVHNELEALHLPFVGLKSGGSIVLNPTEALVAVDVNSGRSTRERHIEETALRTNLEACDEIARQLRLRDLAGLIVVDFIDMENTRNQGQVERRLKEAMKLDRARVQIGRISPFGLLELSRQRLRPSLLETSFEVCPSCSGTGLRRSKESTALAILRRIEQTLMDGKAGTVNAAMPTTVAFYLLNQKRKALLAIEDRFQVGISVMPRDDLPPPHFEIEVSGEPPVEAEPMPIVEELVEADGAEVEDAAGAMAERGDDAKRSRRRRPRRRGRTEGETTEVAASDTDETAPADAEDGISDETETMEADEAADAGSDRHDAEQSEDAASLAKKRRRRGRRGGRRRPRRSGEEAVEAEAEAATGYATGPFSSLPGPGTLLAGPATDHDHDHGFEDRDALATADEAGPEAPGVTAGMAPDGTGAPFDVIGVAHDEPGSETPGGPVEAEAPSEAPEHAPEPMAPATMQPTPGTEPAEPVTEEALAEVEMAAPMVAGGWGEPSPPANGESSAVPMRHDADQRAVPESAGPQMDGSDVAGDDEADTADDEPVAEGRGAGHSVVVHVGSGDDGAADSRRRGWWRRSLE